jgi:hypothetical protein
VEIYDSTFKSNTAYNGVSTSEAVLRNFPDFSAPIPGGSHGTLEQLWKLLFIFTYLLF